MATQPIASETKHSSESGSSPCCAVVNPEAIRNESMDLARVQTALDCLRYVANKTESTERAMKLLASEEEYLKASVDLMMNGA